MHVFYDAATGAISHTLDTDDTTILARQTGPSVVVASLPGPIAACKVVAGSVTLDSAANTALQWSALRRQRDALLAACDWTQMPDNPDPLKSQWATYRQALRDLPANTTDPANPAWPTQP